MAYRPGGLSMARNQSAYVALLLASLLCARATPALAQEPGGAHMFVSGGKLWFPEENQLGQGDMRICSLTPRRPSVDFDLAFGLVSVLVPIADLDVALPLRVAPGTLVIPRVGATAMAALGTIGGYATGWNYGLGLVLNAQGPLLFRADYAARQLQGVESELDGPTHALTLGVGWTF